jgi:hypothetical protein
MASKTSQHNLKDHNLLPPIIPFSKDDLRENVRNESKHVTIHERNEQRMKYATHLCGSTNNIPFLVTQHTITSIPSTNIGNVSKVLQRLG